MSETINNTELLKAAREVPCIEVRDEAAPEKAGLCAGPFYPGMESELVAKIKALPQREPYLIALDEMGRVNLYRRPRK